MTKTEQKVIKFIDSHNLISGGDKILAALSGGPDSIFLLLFLKKYKRKYNIEIAAFHLNHMLRGKAADEDEKFCRNFCSSINIPFFSVKTNIKEKAKKEKISIEEAGRNERYALLQYIAKQNGYSKIATGHNLNDNTETVLLNLIKGTGIRGISGIPVKRGKIIRPLLGISKEEIISFLNNNGIEYLTDKTNLVSDYERNFIRNRIIPAIRKRLNPSVDEAVLRSSETFRNIANYIDKKSSESAEKLIKYSGSGKIDIERLKKMETELQPEILKKIIERNFRTPLSFKDTMSVLSLIDKEAGAKVQLPGKLIVMRERTFLEILEKDDSGTGEFRIKTGDRCYINGMELGIEEWNGEVQFSENRSIEYIDGELAGDDFIIRPWKAGDKFTPLGMKGTVKVSDFLNSLKIASSQKKNKMVLTDNKDIIWVIGYRINEKFKIKPGTGRKLKIWMK